MNCPKCSSGRVSEAPEEAPPSAQQWMKCWACGKRWDQAGVLPKVVDDESDEENQESSDQPVPKRKRTVDELMGILNTVMKDARAKRGQPEQEDEEEPMGSAMNGTCSKKYCEEPVAPNSVRCVRHRDEQRASNEAYRARQAEQAGKPAPKKRGRKPKASVPAIATPKTAARTDGPAEIRVLPPAGPDSVRGIDAAIEAMRADLASLERAREILQSRNATA